MHPHLWAVEPEGFLDGILSEAESQSSDDSALTYTASPELKEIVVFKHLGQKIILIGHASKDYRLINGTFTI